MPEREELGNEELTGNTGFEEVAPGEHGVEGGLVGFLIGGVNLKVCLKVSGEAWE